MLFGIKLEGWLTIGAIILGPLLAFFVQDYRDKQRERRNRQTDIFRRLLLTLKVPLAPSHVDALNAIPLEFPSNQRVLDAWRLYSSHLNVPQPSQPSPQASEQIARWAEKKFDLLIDLIYEISQSLGQYPQINKASLRDNTYMPKGHVDSEEELRQIRAAWLEVLKGERPIPMTMLGPVQVERSMDSLAEIPTARPVAAQPALPAVPLQENEKR
jgi:hypothetical protein